jgi:hypothetical protein
MCSAVRLRKTDKDTLRLRLLGNTVCLGTLHVLQGDERDMFFFSRNGLELTAWTA